MELPVSARNTFIVDAPDGTIPVASGIVVQKFSEPFGADLDLSPLPPEHQRWMLQVGGRQSFDVSFVAKQETTMEKQLVLSRVDSYYELSNLGLHLDVKLNLDIYNGALSRVRVALDAPLQLISARIGEQALRWSLGEDGKHIVIDLPAEIVGTGNQIQLTAICPVQMVKTWSLPRVHQLDAVWRSAVARLTVREPIELIRMDPRKDCRSAGVSVVSGPQAGETHEIQLIRKTAEFDVVLDDAKVRAIESRVVNVGISADQINAVVNSELTVGRSSLRELTGEIDGTWALENVVCNPPELLAGFEVQNQRLKIRFRDAIRAGRTVRIKLLMSQPRLQTPKSLPITFFRPFNYDSTMIDKQVVAMRPADGFQLAIFQDSRVDYTLPADFPAEILQLVDQPEGAVLFNDGTAADFLAVELQAHLPQFSANIEVDALAAAQRDTDGTIDQQIRVRITPQSTTVREIRIQLSNTDVDPQWRVEGEPSSALVVTRVDQISAGPGEGSEWRIQLRRPRSEPVNLVAKFTRPLPSTPLSVALATVQDAATQMGVLRIRADENTALAIDNIGLKPIPAESRSASEYTREVAVFRYTPTRNDQLSIVASLREEDDRAAWIWRSELSSRFFASGKVLHSWRAQVENQGMQEIRFRLPDDVRMEVVLVNGVDVQPQQEGKTLVVSLPASQRFPHVELRYSSQSQKLASRGALAPVIPEVDIPIVDGEWRVWLPPGFASADRSEMEFSNWSERLFAALHRKVLFSHFSGPQVPVFSWRGEQWKRTQAEKSLNQFLGWLGSSALSQPRQSWSQILQDYDDLSASDGFSAWPRLELDLDELNYIHLTPASEIVQDPSGVPASLGAKILAQANVSILMVDGTVVLTSSRRIANLGASVSKLSSAWLARDDVRLSRLVAASAWDDGERFSRQPWNRAVSRKYSSIGDRGWSMVSVPLTMNNGSSQITFNYYCPTTIFAIGWIVMLLGGLLSLHFATKFPQLTLGVLGIAGLVTLSSFLPFSFVPIFSGLFVGLLLGGVGSVLRLHRKRIQATMLTTPDDTSHGQSRFALLSLLVIVALLVTSTVSWADDGEPADDVKRYAVLFPVEGALKDYVYLPLELHELLYRKAALSQRTTRGAILTKAFYQASLTREPATKGLLMSDIVASFNVSVIQSGAKVVLPFRPGQIVVRETRVDGQPVIARRASDGQSMELTISQPGSHQLTIVFRVRVEQQQGMSEVRLPIPSVPATQFRLKVDEHFKNVKFPAAQGLVYQEELSGTWIAELGPAKELLLQWPEDIAAAAGANETDVDELYWLRIRPGSVQADAKLHFSASTSPIRSVRLTTDPRMRLLQLDEERILRKSIRVGETQVIDLEFKPPYTKEETVTATFLLEDSTGIGDIRLPAIQAAASQTARRWVGISASPALRYELNNVPEEGELQVPRFMSAWGESETTPLSALQLPPTAAVWSVLAEPRKPRRSVDERLHVKIGSARTESKYKAVMTTEDGAAFQQRIIAPKDFVITRVAALQENQSRLLRWARATDGAIALWFDGPLQGAVDLEVSGWQSNDKGARIPKIYSDLIGNGSTTKNRVLKIAVYRATAVNFEIPVVAGWAELEATDDTIFEREFGEPQIALQPVGNRVNWSSLGKPLRVDRNAPLTNCRTVTTMGYEEQNWFANVECKLQVTSVGVVDYFRLDIPDVWSGPFQIDPPMSYVVKQRADTSRRILEIRLAQPLTDELTFTIRGPLKTAARERVRSPEIAPLDIQQPRQFLVLPKTLDNQRIAWETSRRLLPITLPDKREAYRISGPNAHATIRRIDRGEDMSHAQVRLQDVHVAWNERGKCYGTVSFDVEPEGRSTCILKMPTTFKLVNASVATLPASLQALQGNRWRIQLGPEQLPQRIEIVFQGIIARGTTTTVLPMPLLEGIDVERTLVTVIGPRDSKGLQLLDGLTEVEPVQLDRFRQDSIAQLLDLTADVVAENAPQEIADWYFPWIMRLNRARRNLATHSNGEDPALLAQQQAIADDLGTSEVLETVLASELPAVRASIWMESSIKVSGTTLGTVEAINVSQMSSRVSRSLNHWIVAGLLVLCSWGFSTKTMRKWFAQWNARWPYWPVPFLGVLWMMVLFPTLLGVVVLAISVWWAIRPRLKRGTV